MGNSKPGRLQVAMEVLAILALTAVQVWSAMPPDERMWIRVSLSERLSRLTGRVAGLASRAGRAGMADELAGKGQVARSRYGAALAWSRLRDTIGRAAQAARP